MLYPTAREARARLEAHRQWDGQDRADLDALTREIATAMYASGDDPDEAIDELIDTAPRMTPAQLARIKRLAAAGDAEAVA